ncbi:winged helix-turn-helix transcriptional regulator [Acidimangrovimonas sediminis]|uniref:winged helix-turn-helix transcriptional regulator n=1 Tax=Acidimangrovimonas sediminis TaxID=2056283 RepID=UPI000C7F9D2F|nr:helix-turn-helix domain-containing protein [Acidimangrovimonas sediminis]
MTKAGETPQRRYEEGCIAAHALDLIGDRWALLVVRELMLGPRRFGAIRAGLPGISANILTRRLGDLQAAGVVETRQIPAPASVQVYALSAAGRGLWPVIRALCRWGAGMPGHDPGLFISPTALMLSMRAMAAPGGPRLTIGFDFDGDGFEGRMDGTYKVARAEVPGGDIGFSGTTNAVAAAVYGPQPLAETAETVGFRGDLALGQAFVDRFHLR